MKILKLKRTFIEGCKSFARNKWLTLATIVLLSLSLYVVGITAILVVAGNIGLENVKKSIDISVYFNPDTEENKIKEIEAKIDEKIFFAKIISS